jgi:phage/plasmid-like protein (TIGR03299 family)
MAHKVETMAYANEVPWHGLGNNVAADMTPEQMMVASGTDWTVSKRQVHFPDTAGKLIQAKGEFVIARDTDDKVLTTVGSTYTPMQNKDMFDFFKKFTEAGGMTMETAGSLAEGKYVWALARIGKDFKIGTGKGADEIRPYLLIMSPHVHGKALIMQYTPIRVVCWNTLSMALGSDLKGNKHGFKMAHSRKWEVVKEEAEAVLGLSIKQTDEFKGAATLLAKAKASKDQTEEFFLKVLQMKPDAKKTPIALPKFRAALEHAPGSMLTTAKGTWWGALNAVTYVVDHELGKDKETSLRGAWIGNHSKTKRRALELAMDYAK